MCVKCVKYELPPKNAASDRQTESHLLPEILASSLPVHRAKSLSMLPSRAIDREISLLVESG